MENIHGYHTRELLQRIAECIENKSTTLNITGLNITSLPELPNSLLELYCDYTNITSLPKLPDSLKYLDCSNTNITSLPELPDSLLELNCCLTKLTSLPKLPDGLRQLYCSGTKLTSLPKLPDSLQDLYCSHTNLTSLPELPDCLTYLNCSYSTTLSSLPKLPDCLLELNCHDTQIILQRKNFEILEEYKLRVNEHNKQEENKLRIRIVERTSIIKEELMMYLYSPGMIEKIVKKTGIDLYSSTLSTHQQEIIDLIFERGNAEIWTTGIGINI